MKTTHAPWKTLPQSSSQEREAPLLFLVKCDPCRVFPQRPSLMWVVPERWRREEGMEGRGPGPRAADTGQGEQRSPGARTHWLPVQVRLHNSPSHLQPLKGQAIAILCTGLGITSAAPSEHLLCTSYPINSSDGILWNMFSYCQARQGSDDTHSHLCLPHTLPPCGSPSKPLLNR